MKHETFVSSFLYVVRTYPRTIDCEFYVNQSWNCFETLCSHCAKLWKIGITFFLWRWVVHLLVLLHDLLLQLLLLPPQVIHLPNKLQLVLRIRCLFDPCIRVGKKSGSGSGKNNPHHITRSSETIFGLKYLNFLMRIRDPDGKNSDPG
jgi:hypothetical protein